MPVGRSLLASVLLLVFLAPVGAAEPAAPADTAQPGTKPAAEKPAVEKPGTDPADTGKTPSGKPAGKLPAGDPFGHPSTAAKGASAEPTDDEYFELYQSLVDTIDQVERNYVRPVNRRELMEAAIEGVLSKLDPYSSYIGRDDIGHFKSAVENQFGGIGIELVSDHDPPQVSTPIVGTPAYRANMQAGDVILEIDGQPTSGMAGGEVVRRLRGEVGTKVLMSIRHLGSETPETVTLTREVIHVDTVRGDHRKADDSWDFMLDADQHIGYIRITTFGRDTETDLKKALQDLQSHGLKGLILDLRFNPGGLLTSAIEVSDLFVSEGRIVGTQGRNSPERVWDAVKPGTFDGFPIVVLVNRYSASASEIVAACLQDHHRAIIVGERTWGKGSVQNVIEMENGRSALKLTIASYQRPSGKNIHRFPDAKESDEWGVHPDDGFELKLGPEETGDLIQSRRQRDVLLAHNKPAEAAPANAAPAEEKPAGEAKPADTKPGEEKPGEEKPGEAKPADSKPAEAKAGDKPAEAKAAPFVDRQLQKAVDYLSQQLARAQ